MRRMGENMFVWVILNYITTDQTIQEVESIQQIVGGEKKIVIVDNASPNNSGMKLTTYFQNSDIVEVIQNSSNEGFARGNNVGYRAALKYSPEFIVFLNNDILVSDRNFQKEVSRIHSKTNFDLFGPDIVGLSSDTHQNPKRPDATSNGRVSEQISKNQALLDHPLRLEVHAWLKSISFIRKPIQRLSRSHLDLRWKFPQENVVLHGSFFVVSRNMMDHFPKQIFFPETFFYFEMEILDLIRKQEGLKSYYSPEIQVEHLQNSSTKKSHTNDSERLRFQAREMVKSGKIFLRVQNRVGELHES